MHICLVLDRFEPLRRSRSCLWTRRQATNPISNLVELRKYFDCWINICCTSHVISHFKFLHYFIVAYSVHHSRSLDNGRGYRLSRRNGGNYYNCASRACGALFPFPSSPRWGANECRLMILGVGGIRQKSYLPCPSVKRGWRKPTWTAALGTFAFHLVLFAKIADTTSR